MAQPNLSYIDQSGGHGSEQSNSSNSYWSKLPQRDRDSLFLLAATHGNLKRMALLLSSGANIDAQNVEGKTPICVIIEQNHPSHDSCLQFLLDNGASIDDNDEGHGNLGGNTNAFSLAYNLGNQRAMEIIMASHPENTIFKPFYDFFLEDSSVKKEIFIQHAVALANFEPRNEYEIALREGTAVSEVVSTYDQDLLSRFEELTASSVSLMKVLLSDGVMHNLVDSLQILSNPFTLICIKICCLQKRKPFYLFGETGKFKLWKQVNSCCRAR